MTEETNEALTAAINVLRDSVETGRMPSGEPLENGADTVHERAAAHLEALRAGAPRVGAAFSDAARPVRLTVELDEVQAEHLAQFLKRVGFNEFRSNAQDNEEAYGMQDAAGQVARALASAGFAPR